jgi:hypothetical protein
MKLGSRTLFDPADVARFVELARAAAIEPQRSVGENDLGAETK